MWMFWTFNFDTYFFCPYKQNKKIRLHSCKITTFCLAVEMFFFFFSHPLSRTQIDCDHRRAPSFRTRAYGSRCIARCCIPRVCAPQPHPQTLSSDSKSHLRHFVLFPTWCLSGWKQQQQQQVEQIPSIQKNQKKHQSRMKSASEHRRWRKAAKLERSRRRRAELEMEVIDVFVWGLEPDYQSNSRLESA